MSEKKHVKTEKNVLEGNFRIAQNLRRMFAQNGVVVLNLVSSPGSGKTTMLVRTITDLFSDFRMAVIEGDQQTSRDTERISSAGVPVHQINTMSGCHLSAAMISKAVKEFDLKNLDVLFIENVGNLVCPAAFDIGEDFRVLILSVTEGEDKPLKYPNMFISSHIVLLNKIDLLSALNFQKDECLGFIKRITPNAKVFEISATSGGEGMKEWYRWLEDAVNLKKKQSE